MSNTPLRLLLLSSLAVCHSALAQPMDGNLVNIMDTKTLVPSTNKPFQRFDPPYFSKNHIVFRGYGADKFSGVYIVQGTRPVTVATTNMPIPAGQGNFLQFGKIVAPSVFSELSFGKGMNDVRHTDLDSPSIDTKHVAFTASGIQQHGVYRFTRGKLTKVVDENTLIPGASGRFTEFRNAITKDGSILFSGKGVGNHQGIYLSVKGELLNIYDVNTIIPAGSGKFTALWHPSFSDNNITFRGEGQNDQQGIYSNASGKLRVVASKRTPIPKGVGRFSGFGAPSIYHRNITFHASGPLEQEGVYARINAKLIRIADKTTAVPDGTGTFVSFETPSIYGNDVVFLGKSVDGKGIYRYHKGKLTTIVAMPSQLHNKALVNLAIGPSPRTQDKIGFVASFSDGSSGIYIAKIAP